MLPNNNLLHQFDVCLDFKLQKNITQNRVTAHVVTVCLHVSRNVLTHGECDKFDSFMLSLFTSRRVGEPQRQWTSDRKMHIRLISSLNQMFHGQKLHVVQQREPT